jgi:glycerol-3-phosphate O-acyltransferase
VRFIVRRFWQGLRGRFKRFGTAAVVFGEPLSLRSFGTERPVEVLADALMDRINAAMPVLMVPLAARALTHVPATMTRDALIAAMERDAATLEDHMPELTEHAFPDAVDFAVEQMAKHKLIETTPQGWRVVPGEEAVVAYYANSIAHRFEGGDAAAE